MSEKQNIDTLFVKFIENTLSKKEYKIFMDFFNKPDYRPYIEKLMDQHWQKTTLLEAAATNEEEQDIQKRFQNIAARIEEHNKIKSSIQENYRRTTKKRMLTFKVVAMAVPILIGFFLFFQNTSINNLLPDPAPRLNTIEAVTLTLDNGEVKVINGDKEQSITDARGNVVGVKKGSQLKYENKTSLKKIVYNELTVPYGNQFELALSDGTQIKMNAGSSIKYPINFINGQSRKVFLKGEAYFNVAKDSVNPFIVNVNDINVQVLGTEFNVSFYPEDNEINTVLVEGSVRIYEGDTGNDIENSTFLKPGQKATWQNFDKNMVVQEVDVELYTAWKEGKLLFRKTPFDNIRIKLERHFDVIIQNNYPFLDTQIYTAAFKNESLFEILEAFKQDTPFSYDYNPQTNILTLFNKPLKLSANE